MQFNPFLQQEFSVLCNQLLRLSGFLPCQTVKRQQFLGHKTDPGFTRLMNDVYMRWSVIVEIDPNTETALSEYCRHRSVTAVEGDLVDMAGRCVPVWEPADQCLRQTPGMPRTLCPRRKGSAMSCGWPKHVNSHTRVFVLCPRFERIRK